MKLFLNNRRVVTLLFTLLIAIIIGVCHHLEAFQRFEWITYDWRMSHFNMHKNAHPDVVVILIDETSLQYMNSEAGRWPWPRSVHADLLDFLALGNPAAVLFDVLFVEQQKGIFVEGGSNSHDQRLIDSSRISQNTYHAAQLRHDPQESLSNNSKKLPDDFIKKHSLKSNPQIKMISGIPYSNYNDFEIPINGLYQAAKGIGIVKADSDRDGIFRRVTLFHQYQNEIFPSLSMVALLHRFKFEKIVLANKNLYLDDRKVPLDENYSMLVNMMGEITNYSYGGIISSYKKIQSGDIENLTVDPAEFENKIVFIGSNAVGVKDLKSTPLSNKTAGVNIHASVVSNFLDNSILYPAQELVTLVAIVIVAIITSLCVIYLKLVKQKLFFPFLLTCIYVYLAIITFNHGLVLDIVPVIFTLIVSYFTFFIYLSFTEGKDKKMVRKMLSQYVSPAVLSTVINRYENYLSAEFGTKENVSIFFSDIRDFTSIAESMQAEKTVEILNTYFCAMTEIIFEFDGTIDKFIGDAVMAFWGAPLKQGNHAIQAVCAARKMLEKLPDVNQTLVDKGYQPLTIGIGINTGDVILGNIGSEKKLDYTVIGDNVNLASRLEGLTKIYGCKIIVSEFTYQQIHTRFPCRIIDLVKVKGKQLPIKVYSPIIDAVDEQSAIQLSVLSQTAFNYYLNQDWENALHYYHMLPDDKIKIIFINRCQSKLLSENTENWDGVFSLSIK